jgi:hypothetical protein
MTTEEDLRLRLAAAGEQFKNAQRTGDIRDTLVVVGLLLESVKLLAAKK